MRVKLFKANKRVIEDIVGKTEKEIKDILNANVEFWKTGSSLFGIKGKKDIDIYIIVSRQDFNKAKKSMSKKYGIPEKERSDKWAKFETIKKGYDLDLFLSILTNQRAKNDRLFWEKLSKNKKLLKEYEKLKLNNSGNIEDYKKAKFEFCQPTHGLKSGAC